MNDVIPFCDRCREKNQVIWFRTKDHCLDLYPGKNGQNQFEDFSEECKEHGLDVKEVNTKTIEVKDIKKGIKIRINRHECGPAILLEFGKELLIAGIVAIIIEIFKKILVKNAKKRKEKIQYSVYVFINNTRIELNLFDEESVIKAIKDSKNSSRTRRK